MVESAQIEDELNALKKQVAGLRRSIMIFIILFAILFATILLSYTKTASVNWLSISKHNKHMAGWWDENGIQIYDSKGVPRLKIGMLGEEPAIQRKRPAAPPFKLMEFVRLV